MELSLALEILFTLYQTPLEALQFGPLLAIFTFGLTLDAESLIFGLNNGFPLPCFCLSDRLIQDLLCGGLGGLNPRLGDALTQEESKEERDRTHPDNDTNDQGVDGWSPPCRTPCDRGVPGNMTSPRRGDDRCPCLERRAHHLPIERK